MAKSGGENPRNPDYPNPNEYADQPEIRLPVEMQNTTAMFLT